MKLREDGLARRCDLLLMTEEEKELFAVMQKIDRLPGDTTAIVVLINQARDLLADYVESSDGVQDRRSVQSQG